MSETAFLVQTSSEQGRVVIHDAACMPAPGPELFIPGHWPDRILLDGGRGSTYAVHAQFGEAVLRRYRRGGAVARYLGDRYLWTGAEHTRPLREFRLLVDACAAGLRVPRPLAAQVQRQGIFYTGDLLMSRISDGLKLSVLLAGLKDWSEFQWANLGNSIGKTHAAGFDHADLNAHNLLSDGMGRIWIVDWDNGRRADPDAGDWPHANVQRLHRSLTKIFAGRLLAADAEQGWAALIEAHARALRTGPPAKPRVRRGQS